MKITKEWLTKENACSDGIAWFLDQKETNGPKLVLKLLKDRAAWSKLGLVFAAWRTLCF